MTEKFEAYRRILLRENAKYNLTAITDPEEIAQKHFADSLSLLEAYDVQQSARLLDVGSGAGFPGAPLAITRPDLRVTLLESTAKKANFLRLLAEELDLPLTVVCARAEQAAHSPALRESFDLVVSRAVAGLPLLCELCLPFVNAGGAFAAYKGTREKTEAELRGAARAITLLGGELLQTAGEATNYGERTLVLIRKIAHTPAIYPRNHGAMVKKPL